MLTTLGQRKAELILKLQTHSVKHNIQRGLKREREGEKEREREREWRELNKLIEQSETNGTDNSNRVL